MTIQALSDSEWVNRSICNILLLLLEYYTSLLIVYILFLLQMHKSRDISSSFCSLLWLSDHFVLVKGGIRTRSRRDLLSGEIWLYIYLLSGPWLWYFSLTPGKPQWRMPEHTSSIHLQSSSTVQNTVRPAKSAIQTLTMTCVKLLLC